MARRFGILVQDSLDGIDQRIRVGDRPLVQERAARGNRAVAANARVDELGEEHQTDVGARAVQDVADVQARRSAAEVDVEQRHVRVEFLDECVDFAGAGAGARFETGPGEQVGEEQRDKGLVLHYENPAGPRIHVPKVRRARRSSPGGQDGYPPAWVVGSRFQAARAGVASGWRPGLPVCPRGARPAGSGPTTPHSG